MEACFPSCSIHLFVMLFLRDYRSSIAIYHIDLWIRHPAEVVDEFFGHLQRNRTGSCPCRRTSEVKNPDKFFSTWCYLLWVCPTSPTQLAD